MTIKARETKFRKRWKLKRQLWKKKKTWKFYFRTIRGRGWVGKKDARRKNQDCTDHGDYI